MPTSTSNMYTVMLLDDHEMVRQGIELGLSKEADLTVIGTFGTGRELLDALARRPADVVVMDFILAPSDNDGLSLIQALNRRFSRCRPLIVCSHYTPATVSLSLKAGCWGNTRENPEPDRTGHRHSNGRPGAYLLAAVYGAGPARHTVSARCREYEIENGRFNLDAVERLSYAQGTGSVALFSGWHVGELDRRKVLA